MAAPPGLGQGLAAPGQALTVPGTTPASGTRVGVAPVAKPTPDRGFRDAHLGMAPKQVRAMQQFLVNHGFAVAQDGILGPQTKAAAAAFRANHKGGVEWSKAHGIAVHPAAQPHDTSGVGADRTLSGVPAAAPAPAAPTGSTAFDQLLTALLAKGGHVGTPFNAAALGNAAAAPDDALAGTLARQAAANPKQTAQDQADISSWYGLNPSDPNYKLSVEGRLGQAKTQDAAAATAASSNIGDLAKSLASSIGGAANDGSGEVAGAGVDAAGTMAALGQVNTDYANAMNPLLAAEGRGAMSRDKATQSQSLLALQDQLAQAQGQGKADRAAAGAGALDKNNALSQQGFANQGNLLSTLAQMQAVDPNEAGLKDAKLAAQIDAIRTGTAAKLAGGAGRASRIDLASAIKGIYNQLGYAGNAAGQGVVPTNDHARLAGAISAYLRSQGFRPGDGQFKKIGDSLFAGFVDEHGRPLVAPSSWTI